MSAIISPSILSADFKKLGLEVEKCINAKCEWLHFDVMDGHFVPNISFGSCVLKCIRDYNIFYDVHLMISDPLKYAPDFIKAGANLITFHVEAYDDKNKIMETIKLIKESGCKVGLSIKPKTPVEKIKEYLPYLDNVLVMSVEPGFGGQKFMETALGKIKELSLMQKNYHYLIEVDGGINEETAKLCRDNGANVLVAGSYLFKHKDFNEGVLSLRWES